MSGLAAEATRPNPAQRRRTSGGKFDPAEPFCYFLATSTSRHMEAVRALPDEGIYEYPHVLVAVNEVETAKDRALLDELCDRRSLLLDSGIYNLTVTHARAHDMTMNDALLLAPEEVDGFDRLYDRYCELVTTYSDRLWGFIELDLGGPLVKPETRARIEADTGLVPMPVCHLLGDGWDYYEALVAEYDRLCMGNLVMANAADRVRMLHAVHERAKAHPDVWHHLLGVTPNPLTHALPIHGSSDSSTWLNGVRWLASWRTGAMGAALGHFPEDFWYVSGKQNLRNGGDGTSNYFRVDGIALMSAMSLEQACRDVRHEYRGEPETGADDE